MLWPVTEVLASVCNRSHQVWLQWISILLPWPCDWTSNTRVQKLLTNPHDSLFVRTIQHHFLPPQPVHHRGWSRAVALSAVHLVKESVGCVCMRLSIYHLCVQLLWQQPTLCCKLPLTNPTFPPPLDNGTFSLRVLLSATSCAPPSVPDSLLLLPPQDSGVQDCVNSLDQVIADNEEDHSVGASPRSTQNARWVAFLAELFSEVRGA